MIDRRTLSFGGSVLRLFGLGFRCTGGHQLAAELKIEDGELGEENGCGRCDEVDLIAKQECSHDPDGLNGQANVVAHLESCPHLPLALNTNRSLNSKAEDGEVQHGNEGTAKGTQYNLQKIERADVKLTQKKESCDHNAVAGQCAKGDALDFLPGIGLKFHGDQFLYWAESCLRVIVEGHRRRAFVPGDFVRCLDQGSNAGFCGADGCENTDDSQKYHDPEAQSEPVLQPIGQQQHGTGRK